MLRDGLAVAVSVDKDDIRKTEQERRSNREVSGCQVPTVRQERLEKQFDADVERQAKAVICDATLHRNSIQKYQDEKESVFKHQTSHFELILLSCWKMVGMESGK